MEVWTEEELHELSKKRQGGLDIPEWKVDDSMKECAKCGYSLRPGWSKCPVCETPVDTKPESEPIEQPIPDLSEDSEELPVEEIEKDLSEDNEDEKVEQ